MQGQRTLVSLQDPSDQQLLQMHSLEKASDLMMYSALDLSEVMNISMGHAQRLLTSASANIAPAYVTAAGLLQRSHSARPLATGLPGLDHALHRGMPVGAITELVGPAGIGKSQMCLMLTVLVAGPAPVGLQAPVVYIDTENKFSGGRLLEIARTRLSEQRQHQQQDQWEAATSAMMERVLLVKPHSSEELTRALYGLDVIVAERGVKLVIIDSIAALARSDLGGSGMASMVARQEMLGLASSLLKSVAEKYQIPLLATNQVSARMNGPAEHAGAIQGVAPAVPAVLAAEGQQGLGAALGTLWAHSVNVRLVLERLGDRRFIKLVKSPISANVGLEYAVTGSGLVQVGQSASLAPESAMHASIANERDHGQEEEAWE